MKMELYKPALDLYLQILKINPNYNKVYSDIGLCLDKLGKQTEAKRYYRKFLSLAPEDEKANVVMRRIEKLKKVKPSSVKLSIV
jgi:tetratricopeptide (TPR) repeat protein